MANHSKGVVEGRLVARDGRRPQNAPSDAEGIALISQRLAEIYGPPITFGRRDEVSFNWDHPYVWPLRIVRAIVRPVVFTLKAIDAGGQWLIGGAAYDLRREREALKRRQGQDTRP